MRISITGRHWDVPAEVRGYATEKLERLARLDHKVDEAHLTFWPERHQIVAEINVHSKQFNAVGKVAADHAQEAFDLAFEKVQLHLRRHKKRVVDQAHGRAKAGEA